MIRKKYPPDWEQIAARIKDKAGWRCQWCGAPHENFRTGRMLTVHHLDRDPSNCSEDNLVALCQRCHLQDEHRARRREAEKSQIILI